MEFFNYRYCILLNNNNESYKINQLINNINKEIKINTSRINNSLDVYIKNHCLIKYKLLSIKHNIIKLLISLYNKNKDIKQNDTDLILLNTKIFQSSQIINIIKSVNIPSYKIEVVLKNQDKYEMKVNDILSIIQSNNIITYMSHINNIMLNLEKYIYKKHRKIFNIMYKSLITIINYYQKIYNSTAFSAHKIEELKYIQYIIELSFYQILQFNKAVVLNNSLLTFFKHKSIICKNNNKLYNNTKKIICVNNKNNKLIIKIKKSIDILICKYMLLCSTIMKKKTNIDLVINKYDIIINKLNDLLNNFKNKLLKIENESENKNIECPPELKKKCIKFNIEDDNICCICLDPILLGIKTSCNHIFHIHCINLFIYSIISNSISEINILCPLCRNYI